MRVRHKFSRDFWNQWSTPGVIECIFKTKLLPWLLHRVINKKNFLERENVPKLTYNNSKTTSLTAVSFTFGTWYVRGGGVFYDRVVINNTNYHVKSLHKSRGDLINYSNVPKGPKYYKFAMLLYLIV
jgi:hypothetical protein